MLNNKRLLIFFLAALTLLLVACGAPPIPERATEGAVMDTAVVEPREAEPTPEAELEVEPEEEPTAEADEVVEEEAEVTVEEATTATIDEPPSFTTVNFDPGQCLIELTEPATTYRAANLDMVQGTLEAGTYGTISFVQLENEANDQFFGVPLSDSRLVYVPFTPNVLPVADCPGVTTASPEQSSSASDPEAAPVEPTLVGTVWQWMGTSSAMDGDDLVVEASEKFTVVFNEDGSLNVQADCNVGGGSYEIDGSGIVIELGAFTRAYCGDDSLDGLFLEQLDTAVIFFFQDGDLFFDRPMDSGTMRFTPAPVADDSDMLLDTVWAWQSITTPVVTVNVPNPEAYTLAFNEDGTVNLQADCKEVGGTFTQENGAINIELGFNTAVVCSPNSLDTTFLDSLSRAALYFFQGGDLYLDLPADSGTMHFTATPTD